MIPTHQRGIDGRGTIAAVAAVAKSRPHQRQAGPALGRRGLLDGLACRPPPGAVLDARLLVEDGDLAPPDTETDVDARRRLQPQPQRGVECVTNCPVAALKFVADREGRRIDGRAAYAAHRSG